MATEFEQPVIVNLEAGSFSYLKIDLKAIGFLDMDLLDKQVFVAGLKVGRWEKGNFLGLVRARFAVSPEGDFIVLFPPYANNLSGQVNFNQPIDLASMRRELGFGEERMFAGFGEILEVIRESGGRLRYICPDFLRPREEVHIPSLDEVLCVHGLMDRKLNRRDIEFVRDTSFCQALVEAHMWPGDAS